MQHLKKNLNYLQKYLVQYLPPEYPYDVVGAQERLKQQILMIEVDILPVADPNIFSQTQE